MLKEQQQDANASSTAFSADTSNFNQSQSQNQTHSLFQQLQSQFFNEMRDDKSMSSEAYVKIDRWLSAHSLEELTALNQLAKEHFLYEGITFTVYGESEGIERTIPFEAGRHS